MPSYHHKDKTSHDRLIIDNGNLHTREHDHYIEKGPTSLHYWPFVKDIRWWKMNSAQRESDAQSVSMSWRHHESHIIEQPIMHTVSEMCAILIIMISITSTDSNNSEASYFLFFTFTCLVWIHLGNTQHYSDVIMGTMASQIPSLTIVYSTVYSGADQRKHQSPASLAFVWGIVTRKMFPFDDVIMSAF